MWLNDSRIMLTHCLNSERKVLTPEKDVPPPWNSATARSPVGTPERCDRPEVTVSPRNSHEIRRQSFNVPIARAFLISRRTMVRGSQKADGDVPPKRVPPSRFTITARELIDPDTGCLYLLLSDGLFGSFGRLVVLRQTQDVSIGTIRV